MSRNLQGWRKTFPPRDADVFYMATLTLYEWLDKRKRKFSYEAKRRENLIRFGKCTEARWKNSGSEAYREIFPISTNIFARNPAWQQNPVCN